MKLEIGEEKKTLFLTLMLKRSTKILTRSLCSIGGIAKSYF
jgi:hypothetical protein